MYFIYSGDVESLAGRKPFGDGECVALVQAVTDVGPTSGWRPGPRVVDLSYLNPGTVVANFVFDRKTGTARFPNKHGYHAALFMDFGGRGVTSGRATTILVMDQFRARKPKDVVLQRPIEGRGKSYIEGNPYHDCDNADQFYVVVGA